MTGAACGTDACATCVRAGTPDVGTAADACCGGGGSASADERAVLAASGAAIALLAAVLVVTGGGAAAVVAGGALFAGVALALLGALSLRRDGLRADRLTSIAIRALPLATAGLLVAVVVRIASAAID